MIITIDELLGCGLQISEELSNERLQMAIYTAEQYVVKPRLGDEMYLAITDDPESYYYVINGGIVTKDDKDIYLAGLKQAMYHLAYAFLLRDNLVVTVFSTVRKTDEYSENVGDDKILAVGMQHGEIGLWYLKEVTDYLGIKNENKNLPNSYFSEFL